MPLSAYFPPASSVLARTGDAQATGRPKRTFVLRIIDALTEANRRKADAEVARFVARNGGHLTDDLERLISQRYGSPVRG